RRFSFTSSPRPPPFGHSDRVRPNCALAPTPSSTQPPAVRMLTITGLTKAFGGRTLFADVSLHVNRQDRIGLVGPNGVGKTTLFSLILRDGSPDAGRITLPRNVT